MKYMMLIYGIENTGASVSQEQMEAEINAYNTFTADANKAGVMVDGEALHPISAATTVRVRDGKTMTTDGPFAETREQLGGYYILDCKDLDEAIAWGAKIPGAANGSVEIRPIVVF